MINAGCEGNSPFANTPLVYEIFGPKWVNNYKKETI